MRKRKKIKTLTAEFLLLAGTLIILMLSSTACKEDDKSMPVPSPAKDTSKVTEKKKNDQQESDKKNSTAEQKKEYSYNPSGKVDPFTPLITSSPSPEPALPGTGAKEKQDVPLSPLQKLEIEDFNLVAVITTDKKLTALLEDPATNGYIVKEGMLIGRNGGIIKKILPNSMLIEEQTQDDQGKKEIKIKTITLKKK